MQEQIEKGNLNIKVVVSIMIGVVLFVAWFYNSVIIPIKQVQVSIAQIQISLSDQTLSYKSLDSRLNIVENKLNIKK